MFVDHNESDIDERSWSKPLQLQLEVEQLQLSHASKTIPCHGWISNCVKNDAKSCFAKVICNDLTL
eukprot:3981303-Amphidinium_carterae.1